MIKAVKNSLILILLFAGVAQGHGQTSPADDAGLEAVRREANKILMRKTIDEARVARTRGDTQEAIFKYEEAWRLSQNLTGVDAERGQIQGELVPIRVELAKKAQTTGNTAEANTQLTRALMINPKDPVALKEKAENDRRIAERQGKFPDERVTSRADEFNRERVATSTKVQNARFLIEMGRLKEAENLLKEAAKEDPESRPTFYYLNLIKEQVYAQEARKREIEMKDRMVEIERSWNRPAQRDQLPPFGNPYATTNTVHTSTPRQALFRKLDTIRIDDFPLSSDVDLIEVLKELGSEVKKRDVNGKGVNLLIAQAADRPVQTAGAGAIDPNTGLPLPATSSADIDVEKFKIKFDPPIRDVTLKQFLDAIVLVAKPPEGAASTAALKYSVEDYAIVFSQRTQETEQFFTRTYRLDPNTFRQGLEGVSFSANPFQGLVVSQGGAGGAGGGGGGGLGGQQGQNGQGSGPGGFFTFGGSTQGGGQGGGGGGGGGGGQNGQGTGITLVTVVTNTSTIQTEVRAFFSAAGVDFPTNAAGGLGGGAGQFAAQQIPGQPAPATKAMFFNDRAGVLFVRAPLRDLDIIEQALHALNVLPPQVTIEAKFAEFSQTDSKGLGFDWYLGNMTFAGGKTGIGGGTQPSATGARTFANPSGIFPNDSTGLGLTRLDSDGLVTSGLRGQGLPTVATMTGILTSPQFRVAIKAIENRAGVDLLSAPTITTISGRQARISVEETRTIITGLQVQGLGNNGGVAAAGAGTP